MCALVSADVSAVNPGLSISRSGHLAAKFTSFFAFAFS